MTRFSGGACLTIAIILVAVCCLAINADAGPPVLMISGSAEYLPSTDVAHGDTKGSVSELRSGFSLVHPMMLKNDATASLMMSFYRNDYEWKGEETLNPGNSEEPWDTLYSVRIGAGYEKMMNQRWGYFGGVGFGASWEKAADNSLSGNIAAGFVFKKSEKLELKFGAGIFSHASGGSVGANDNMPLFDDTLRTGVMPFLGIAWNKNGDGLSAELGYDKIEAAYRFNRMLSIACNFGIEGGEYLLSDDNPVYPDGYVGMSGFSTGVSATLGLPPGIRLTLGAGYVYDRKWEIFDEDGNEVDQLDIDNIMMYRLNLMYAF